MSAVRGKVPQWKVDAVEEIKRLFREYPVVGIAGFRGVPSSQFQSVRRDLRDEVAIRVVKNTLLKLALESLGGDYKKLEDYIEDQVAVVASKLNPFKLFKKLENTKTPSPLKPNQVSPVDVVVEAGPTNFPPGPILGEIQAAGIPAAIEKGKIVVKNTVTVVRAGEVVKPEVARALNLLEVKPIKIGLDTKALMENGIVFTPADLAIDEAQVFEDFIEAARKALNLAVNSAYVTEETAEILIQKAFLDAKNLAINAAVFEKEVMPDILAKAYSEMLAVANLLSDEALDEDLKERLSGLSVAAQQPAAEQVDEAKEEEEEEEEEPKEEEALEGLGALFG
ncbi:50S ribosomal protein L10 [Geoglobus acetivorans]|uniref:Large ribosomal subunit protein uL10 n=1 Tax=Geoglobus acetivorans TaxID=565033 RepID=A0ABZ3H4N3_GEOAI|nr:50S ribosomal protein L10 [Geoglobus acetivorans]